MVETTKRDGRPGRRCAFVGDEALLVQCIQIAQVAGLVPVLVSTAQPIVRDLAVELGIPVVGPGAELAAGLDEHPADVLLSIANLRVIPDDVLARVSVAINYHDGPLPGYAGLNVTTWALLSDEPTHAVTWHLMTDAIDGGEAVATESFAVEPDDTAFSLNARCYEAALASFPRVADALASGDLVTTPQPVGVQRMFRRHQRPAVLFDPTAPAAATARTVRALDLGGRIANRVGAVRWILGADVVVVGRAEAIEGPASAPAGTLVAVEGEDLRIATREGDLRVGDLCTAEGVPLETSAVLTSSELALGERIPAPDPALVERLTGLEPLLARDERWNLDRLAAVEDASAPPATTPSPVMRQRVSVGLPPGAETAPVVASVALWVARTSGLDTVSLGVTDGASRSTLEDLAPLVRPAVAVISVDGEVTFAELVDHVAAEVDVARGRAPMLRDAIGRDPRTRGRSRRLQVLIDLDADPAPTDGSPLAGSAVAGTPPLSTPDAALAMAVSSSRLVLEGDTDPTDPEALDRIAEQIVTLLSGGLAEPATRTGLLEVVGPAEQSRLDAGNRTDLDHDRTATIDALFRERAGLTPDAPALSFGDRTLTYLELSGLVDAVAGRLTAAGVRRGDRVGVGVPRGVDMVVGVLATLQVGAAYVPLDPTYPLDRLGFMVDDARVRALLATGEVAVQLARPGTAVIDPVAPCAEAVRDEQPVAHDASDLAYVIYTSGSTGLPKGVMLEHRQVVNFFAAMDEVIDPDPAGVWLAVTSLSFDISVLELLWTLTRGLHVVVKADSGVAAAAPVPAAAGRPARPVSFSLFYFAAGEEAAADGYRLLLDSARVADRHGFEAVWTPERHFHAFGGSYPNPSVTGAALAAVTEHVGIRAGSVVLPLHSPIRVAEEWAVVDNLSRGRVAISFAPGWQPDDFVLNPTAYASAREDLPRSIEVVQRLWRGESVALPGHDGQPVEVRTLPRPAQSELPVWLTSAGTPATFERAGTLGVNVLTHLLGQSVEQLSDNIARYRAAWTSAGHEGEGRVTLMMHTYLDRDGDTAREVAREPMKGYLGTAVGLLRDVASAFPTFANRGDVADDILASLSPAELDQLLEVAAQRYLGTSGLFGTARDAAATVEAVSAAGVDEVACLVDFGIDTDAVMQSLDLLLEAKGLVDARRETAPGPLDDIDTTSNADPTADSVAALVARHRVTHLQCTPSLAAMLLADPADRGALGEIRHLMLGGEALPAAMASELRDMLPGRFTNMYGPTETTIWSLTHEIGPASVASVPIGTPIANTTIFVLDPAGRRVPIGTYGELHIGGEGVARGYLDRPELTAARFVERPGSGRVYATGDVVRVRPDGVVEFAGRSDNQVKIRGHRIELGEIEALLDDHPAVIQSVVVARVDGGDTRLAAYVITEAGKPVTPADLRQHVADSLPPAMVPAAVALVEAFPLTPNGKVDRKALAAAELDLGPVELSASAPPADETEALVAGVWTEELGVPVGRDDNFFDIGGHSLLAVKVFRRLADATGAPLALTDVFRFPTVRTFATHIGDLAGAPAAGSAPASTGGATGVDRAAMRRRALTGRGRGGAQ